MCDYLLRYVLITNLLFRKYTGEKWDSTFKRHSDI